MPPTTDDVLLQLAQLTGDLEPDSPVHHLDLEEARAVVAQALSSGQPIPTGADGHLPSVPLTDLSETLDLPDLTRTDLMIHRRSLPIFSTQFASSLPTWAAGLKVEKTLGPFRDRNGRASWIDVFRRVRQVRLVRNAGAAAFILLPLSLLERFNSALIGKKHPLPSRFDLPAGSLWLASQLLASAAPHGSYTGLRIKGGVVSFNQHVSVIGDEIIVPAAVIIQLEVELEVESTVSGAGPGGDARAAQSTPPKHIQLTISASGATLKTGDTARLVAYGAASELEFVAADPHYIPTLNRLTIAFKITNPSFEIKHVESKTFLPSGSTTCHEAAWGLPVAVIDPMHLGEASGVGALMLWLNKGLQTTWLGQVEPVDLGPCLLMVDASRLMLVARDAHGERVQQTPTLWAATPRNHLNLRWNLHFPVSFFSQAEGSEAVLTEANVEASLERPVDVRGERLPLTALRAVVGLIENTQGQFLLLEGIPIPPAGLKMLGFGLVNALMRTGFPTAFVLYARYDGVRCPSGAFVLVYRLFGVLPTLPDPYAANYTSLRSALDQSSGNLLSLATWEPGKTDFDFVLPPSNSQQSVTGIRSPQATSGMGLAEAQPTTFATRENKNLWPGAIKALGNALEFERQRGLILLDVSTNVDQFGIAFKQDLEHRPSMGIKRLHLELDGRHLLLLTLPAVQWEAVHTIEDPEPFPERLGFANSGVPTLISVPTVNLVPIHPAAALQTLVENFALPTPQTTMLRFTLPFGIIAQASLHAPNAFESRGASLKMNRPNHGTLEGAHQLQIDALDPSLPSDASASLAGFTAQLPLGQPGFRSVLGDSVTTLFNTYLGAGGFRPLIPVTRFELSGYGESLFSDWHNPYPEAAAVDQARFDVLVGRTAHEVVQVRSILYPYAVKVIRTITIERKNNAAVTRRDSGWKAANDGVYQFPTPSQIETHPGVVRRITQVSHIRETGQVLTVDGIELAAVYFNGDLELDGAAGLVPARDQFGFVQITAGDPIPPSTYAKLIERAGSLGGLIDSNLQVGGGTQAVRVNQVGVGVTPGLAGPEFVMTAWGAPVFPGGGEWSVLRIDAPTAAPQVVPRERGLPLIRAGLAGTAPALTSPYRFADPEDLSRPSNPDHDYGILHATGTQRVFFPRPRIEASDTARIVSSQIPAIADPYSLATSVGVFPELSKTIPFPSNTWALRVAVGGQYKLELPSNTFPAAVGRRTMRQAGSVKGDLDYTSAQVTYELDTSQVVPWRFRLEGAAKIMNSNTLGDVIQVKSNVLAMAGKDTVFEEPKLKMGGALSVVQDLLTILADIGISGIMHVDMTNDWSLKIALTIPFVDATGEPFQIPPIVPFPDIKFEDTGVKVEIKVLPTSDEAVFELAGSPMFAIKQIPGLYVVAIIKFSIKLSTSEGTLYTLFLGVGIAYSLDAGPFGFKGLFALTFFGFIGDTTIGFGIGFLLKLGAELKPIISIEISLEGKLALVWACKGALNESLYGAAKLTFGVEISICLVFSISFEVETTGSQILRGSGACPLPDVL